MVIVDERNIIHEFDWFMHNMHEFDWSTYNKHNVMEGNGFFIIDLFMPLLIIAQ